MVKNDPKLKIEKPFRHPTIMKWFDIFKECTCTMYVEEKKFVAGCITCRQRGHERGVDIFITNNCPYWLYTLINHAKFEWPGFRIIVLQFVSKFHDNDDGVLCDVYNLSWFWTAEESTKVHVSSYFIISRNSKDVIWMMWKKCIDHLTFIEPSFIVVFFALQRWYSGYGYLEDEG